MIGATKSSAGCITMELEIGIDAPREVVWEAIFKEANAWWLPDFRVSGPDSKVTFDPKPGGRGLIEETTDGGGLQWFQTQMYLPADFKIYVVGHIAPEWGGPTTSNLKLALEETKSGCVLKITDARHGNIDEAQTKSYEDGWRMLFSDGLKKHIESK